jgi:hypothetical protein
MDIDPASAHNAASTRLHGHRARHILLAAVAVAAVLLALCLPRAWSDQRTSTVVTGSAVPSAPPYAQPSVNPARSPSSDKAHGSRFFGFLEYDWDPDAPGGVPGFDPWPGTQQHK